MDTKKLYMILENIRLKMGTGFTKEDREAIKEAKTLVGTYDQLKWEHDLAISQLHDLGYELGEISHKDEKEEELE